MARMMAPVATELGITLRVLVESEQASAALAAHETVVGVPTDPDAVARLLSGVPPAVLTWEHEHIPAAVFDACQRAGVPALPEAAALISAQDKIVMRENMDRWGLPSPAWAPVTSVEDVADFLAAHDGIGVLKTARGGYDGKGVRVIRDAAQAREWLDMARENGPRLLIEQHVAFDRELAALVARRPSGQVRAWPVVQSVQVDGMCSEVIAPAPDVPATVATQAQQIARTIATQTEVVGVLAVEMFLVGGQLMVNELAMRPHNSGHWTMDGAVTGQFEQHLRAVLDLPLGSTEPTAPWSVMANVLGSARPALTDALAEIDDSDVRVHLYGKEVRPGRKLGHVTVSGNDVDDLRARAAHAAAIVRGGGGR